MTNRWQVNFFCSGRAFATMCEAAALSDQQQLVSLPNLDGNFCLAVELHWYRNTQWQKCENFVCLNIFTVLIVNVKSTICAKFNGFSSLDLGWVATNFFGWVKKVQTIKVDFCFWVINRSYKSIQNQLPILVYSPKLQCSYTLWPVNQ